MIHRRRIIGGFAVWVVLTQICSAQSLLYEVALETRIDQSEVIVEGRVVGQAPFLEPSRNRIHTVNTVEVYRVFKGSVERRTIEIVTPGGFMEHRVDVIHPSQSLNEGDVGVFLLAANRRFPIRSNLGLVAGPQGFISYNELFGGASAPFITFADVDEDLHERIVRRVGRQPAVIVDYRLVPHIVAKRVSKGEASSGEPVITAISPPRLSAGTGSVLTIRGSGFADYVPGVSTVLFHNPDYGDFPLASTKPPIQYIVAWSDTLIEIMVPAEAFTGTVAIVTSDRHFVVSTQTLYIDFNRREVVFPGTKSGPEPTPNEARWTPSLIDANGEGGYTLYVSTPAGGVDFLTSPGVAPFKRALRTWRNGTGLNFKLGGSLTDEVQTDNPSAYGVVAFDILDDFDTRGEAVTTFVSCPESSTWWLDTFWITFAVDGTGFISWDFGPQIGIDDDFEHVALHELGHAHLLGHINAQGKLMHYDGTNLRTRTLDPDSDIAGGLSVLSETEGLAACGQRPMVQLEPEPVEEVPIAPLSGMGELFPNPFSGDSRVTLILALDESVVAELFDALGRKVRTEFEAEVPAATPTDVHINGRDLSSGLYFLRIRAASWSETRVVVKM